jgi:hypothetical protein
MTVYAESNFVLEITLGQRETAAVEAILALAAAGRVALALPSFALFEPFSIVTHRGRRRKQLLSQMNEEIRELRRSRPHVEDLHKLEPMASLFAAIEDREKERLHETVQQLFAVAEVIEIDAETYNTAIDFHRLYYFAQVQDAIICSAVFGRLERTRLPGPHYFATRNVSDFSHGDIIARFADRQCTIVPTFTECLQRLRGSASPSRLG